VAVHAGSMVAGLANLKQRFVFFVVLAVTASPTGSVGAASFAQQCDGPPATTQSGRALLAPGVNALRIAQTVSVKVSLFNCSPARATRGSGRLRTTVKPEGSQTCKMFSAPTKWNAAAHVTWKDNATSTLSMTLSLAGPSHLINLTGKVTSGLFRNHTVTGQFRYIEVVSPAGKYTGSKGIARACANRVAPTKFGRIVISALDLYTTKHFVIS